MSASSWFDTEREKTLPKAISFLREDIQAMALLVEKAICQEKAQQYPIILLLSLANLDGSLK